MFARCLRDFLGFPVPRILLCTHMYLCVYLCVFTLSRPGSEDVKIAYMLVPGIEARKGMLEMYPNLAMRSQHIKRLC